MKEALAKSYDNDNDKNRNTNYKKSNIDWSLHVSMVHHPIKQNLKYKVLFFLKDSCFKKVFILQVLKRPLFCMPCGKLLKVLAVSLVN